MDKLETMRELLINAIEDMEKFEKGNSAAGTRVRKDMQQIKVLAQEVRVFISAKKKEK